MRPSQNENSVQGHGGAMSNGTAAFVRYKQLVGTRFWYELDALKRDVKNLCFAIRQNYLTILLGLQICNFVFYFVYTFAEGYLPPPFIHAKNDTFMDFFHTAYWSLDSGRYTEWGSVYPPLVFLTIRGVVGFFPQAETAHDGFHMRFLWPEANVLLIFSYIFTIAAAVLIQLKKRFDATSLSWAIFFLLSPPALFALERGNLIFVLPLLVAISLRGNGWQRMLAEAIMINIKPYMVLFLIRYVVRKDFRGFVQAVSLNLAIFLVTGIAIDASFPEFFMNFMNFNAVPFQWAPQGLTSMSASPGLFAYLADYTYTLGDNYFELAPMVRYLARIPITLCYGFGIAALFFAFKNSAKITDFQLVALICAIISNFIMSAGGYSLLLYVGVALSFVPGGKVSKLTQFFIVALFTPLDLVVVDYFTDYVGVAYVTGRWVEALDFNMVASILRPLMNMVVLGSLAWQMARPFEPATEATKVMP